MMAVQKNSLRALKCLLIFTSNLLSYESFAQEVDIKDCFVDANHELKYCIASDSLTYDKIFGDSYRLLLISDVKNNTITQSYYLNINTSPDFPYGLKTDYLEGHGLLLIQGYASFYLYSVEDQIISKQVFPDYTNCNFSDQQGMMIHDLTIMEHGSVLELGIRECGLHRFDIRDIEQIVELK